MTATKIEWTDAVWNFVTGCSHVSAGCDNCYAERIATRFGRPFIDAVEVHPEKIRDPLRWRKPRRVFVNSVSDLFHPDVDDLSLAEAFAVMSLTPQHTYQILTKRHKAMKGVLESDDWWYKVWLARRRLLNRNIAADRREREYQPVRPLPNVWLGVSVENQRYADLRIPHLLDTPAAVRFLSVEPLLGPVDLSEFLGGRTGAGSEPLSAGGKNACEDRRDGGILAGRSSELSGTATPEPNASSYSTTDAAAASQGIGWVIVGGESGNPARPMHPEWARTIRDQCIAAEVPYFFKQWGTWGVADAGRGAVWVHRDASTLPWEPIDGETSPYAVAMRPLGKGRTGRELDGRVWDEYPGMNDDLLR